MKKKLFKLFVLLALMSSNTTAQTAGYSYQAAINDIPADGFYNIVLTPGINACVKNDYNDLRIVNSSGKWVPHLLRSPNDEITSDAVTWERKIIKNTSTKFTTEIIIEGGNTSISNLVFTLKNAMTDRFCTLTASDDMNAWFIVNDSIKIITKKKNGENTSDFVLLFPPVNYKYFKVRINNNNKEPLNIISAGTEGIVDLPNSHKHYPEIENPICVISQKDSGTISYIKADQLAPYHFETVALKLSGVKYYNRNTELYIPLPGAHSFSNPGQLISTFSISNNSTLQFKVPLSNAKTFYILIHNDDNLPLKVEEVKTYTSYHVATAYLEKSNSYKLLLGNTEASTPNYDLSLKDVLLKDSLPQLNIGPITAAAKTAEITGQKDNSKKMIWLTIGLAALVLGFFTYRLVTDMNKSKS